jgi:hypothetical protein
MRRYSLVFMEQRIGTAQLQAAPGEGGCTSFTAVDDEAALAYIGEHCIERLKTCVRAELSSLLIVPSPTSTDGIRLVDDTHGNPRFQDTYVRYNAATRGVEMDWDSTRTSLFTEFQA